MKQYETRPIGDFLRGNPYVGRGVALGCTPSGRAALVYFIMGRSANSRNRVFVKEGDALVTRPFDESKVEDPSLIIYSAVRTVQNHTVVTNGDQTDTVCDFLAAGKSAIDALRTRCFEPDGPNWTPRISGVLTAEAGGFSYQLSILKSADAAGTACTREFFEYPALPGVGHFIHTYAGDGSPLPTFGGEPARFAVPDDIDALTDEIWAQLNPDNKIALYVRMFRPQGGAAEERLINKYGKDVQK